MKNELLYEFDGNMGKILKVYNDHCAIEVKEGLKSALFGSFTSGLKEFYYEDITTVQFKNLGITTGYLQFEYPGAVNLNNFQSENSFVFSASMGTRKYKEFKNKMPGIYEDIKEKVNLAKKEKKNKANTTIISSADEIIKFKNLLDSGVISQEEFNLKKKQLLEL